MSGPNQTSREFSDDIRDLLRTEKALLRDLDFANEMVRLAGMREARQIPVWSGELRAIYSMRDRALSNLLAFREAIVRLRLESTQVWIVKPTPVMEDLELVRMLPGKILRMPAQVHHIAQGPDQTQVQMPDGSLPRPDLPISSGRRTGDALPGILQMGVDATSPMRWDSSDIFFTRPPESRTTGRVDNIDAGERTDPWRPVEDQRVSTTVENLARALGAMEGRSDPQRDGVPCDRCEAVVRPADSYPVLWIGTKSHVALCEGCFRSEHEAGRARPCAGLDEEAT